jgi:hypothetical protein
VPYAPYRKQEEQCHQEEEQPLVAEGNHQNQLKTENRNLAEQPVGQNVHPPRVEPQGLREMKVTTVQARCNKMLLKEELTKQPL